MEATRFSTNSDAVEWIAVSIEKTPQCNLHTGIIYRTVSRELKWLHLAWHKQLKNEICATSKPCAKPLLDSADAMFLSGFCERIARSSKNRQIPYNFRHDPAITFDPNTGDINTGIDSTGLGCATFVIAVFRSAGNSLIDVSSWPPPDEEDKQQRQNLIEALRRGDDSHKQQADRIEPEIESPRIRPEQIAGACLEDDRPATFEKCEPNGKWVRGQLFAAA